MDQPCIVITSQIHVAFFFFSVHAHEEKNPTPNEIFKNKAEILNWIAVAVMLFFFVLRAFHWLRLFLFTFAAAAVVSFEWSLPFFKCCKNIHVVISFDFFLFCQLLLNS